MADMSDPSEPTGNPAVDDVLELLGDLDELPVDEHVAVFETAHEKLRGALDAQLRKHLQQIVPS